ncbi:LOW QUALITY PROTEIN: NDR1/HIN1-like protein 13 [Carica papaya]|uniref:LOW QUALITY PROTEIN: NDR1/HIN1-like protein 13 n=1 Tax=Carica papaya TaxID=3649 RepID=UPI000B8C8196|nr:LOW QUALITY PROTEIN: NDR1/HIN1-like protein 13 [Carica papaya]
MADRIYPSAKPNANGSAANATTTATTTTANPNPSFPATKAQLYGATRPAYRPQPHHRRRSHSRGCCCSCCLWFSLLILLLIFLLAIAGAVVYLLYRPHRPTFSVSSLKLFSQLTSSSPTCHTSTYVSLQPKQELLYFYDPITISLTTDDNIPVGRGTFPSFVHPTKNTTLLKAVITNGDQQQLDEPSVAKLKTELKRKDGLPLKIKLETKVKAKMGVLKTPKVRARISCEGIKASVPTGKSSTMASTSDAKCKVDLRIKIWKWTF